MIKAATLFSGIGAPEVAMPHWHWLWSSEVDEFACALMQHYYKSNNLGDVTKRSFLRKALDEEVPEVIVFGSPCQSFSIAGARQGLDDPRGTLAFVALALVAKLRPQWFCFENVGGLLSSNEGRDFGAFLGAVAECGYGWSYRVLDSQYFGVAQRRNRVFVIGHLGDWRPAAEVLFEPSCLQGYPPPSREERQGVAFTLTEKPRDRGEKDDNLLAFGGGNQSGAIDIATALTAHGGSQGRLDFDSETFVTHSLRGGGFAGSEDGTGRGTPLVPVKLYQDSEFGVGEYESAGTIRAGRIPAHQMVIQPVCFDASEDGMGHGTSLVPIMTTHEGSNGAGIGMVGDPMFTLDASGSAGVMAFDARARASSGGSTNSLVQSAAVRRLTPRECERLQGFSDDYTLIKFKGKRASDGRRYKALGNSMTVPVMRWILSRIEACVVRNERVRLPRRLSRG